MAKTSDGRRTHVMQIGCRASGVRGAGRSFNLGGGKRVPTDGYYQMLKQLGRFLICNDASNQGHEANNCTTRVCTWPQTTQVPLVGAQTDPMKERTAPQNPK